MQQAIDKVLADQQFILGSYVRSFENEVEKYLGIKHAIGVSSGSAGLVLALMALGIKKGDEVITTPFSFFATASSIVLVGAKPVFVDIDPRTFNLDPTKIEKAISTKTKAIMPVHLFGQCAEMDRILEIAKKHRLYLIEDAAQAFGAKYKGRFAGTMGDVGVFSFFPSKNLGGYGDGGMLITNDDLLAERIRRLRVHGQSQQYLHQEIGLNSRLDALQAVVLQVKLEYLYGWNEKRRANAQLYKQLFERSSIICPMEWPDNYHIYHQYTIMVNKRDHLKQYLTEQGIGSAIYYPLPLHLQPCFKYLGYEKGDFPIAEKCSEKVISIPIYAELTEAQIKKVAETILQFYQA